MHTLADLLPLNTSDRLRGVVEMEVGAHPEVNTIGADNLGEGEFQYDTLFASGDPAVGFTEIREGIAPTKSQLELRTVKCYDLEGRIKVPTNAAARVSGGIQRVLGLEEIRHFRAMLKKLAIAFYYGKTAQAGVDPKAFHGILNLITTDMTVDATGGSNKTSVYAVRTGPLDIQFLLGGGRGLNFSNGEYRIESVKGEGEKEYDAYVATMLLHPGLQALNEHSAARIKNVGKAAGKTLTNTMMMDLVDKFPTGTGPDRLFMTKRSRRQLWDDTKSLPGVSALPDLMTSWMGIPITVTDSISNEETV